MEHIIDAHCHIYPNGIAPKAVAAVDSFYGGLPADHYDGTVDMLVKSGSIAGIGHFIVHSVATSPHQVGRINQFIAQSVAASEGLFTGMGTLHLDSDDLRRDFKALRALGLKGVKLHPDIQRFNADDPRAMRIYEMCEDAGLPVCVHTGDWRYDYSNPNRVVNVLRAFPRLRFIGAHFGGWSVWEAAMKILPDFPNMIVDSSSTFYMVKPGFAGELIRAWGRNAYCSARTIPCGTRRRTSTICINSTSPMTIWSASSGATPRSCSTYDLTTDRRHSA